MEKAPQVLKVYLQRYFGFPSFKPGQEKIITAVLEGKDVLGVIPTGGGKSLCYQLPALLLPGVTLVVSPLIALMKDQVDALTKKHIKVTFINSTLSQREINERLQRIGNGNYKLVYVAPERLRSAAFLQALASVNIRLLAVDEAHCISQWGHDFRPAYLMLKRAVKLLGRPPILALTATATKEVQEDIIRQLGMHNPLRVVRGFDRPNLRFFAVYLKEKAKQKELIRIIRALQGSGIVYVATRRTVDTVLNLLEQQGVSAVGYHGTMNKAQRSEAQNLWLKGQKKVIVATNAFGMGIDKADVRFVIHYNLPGSLEAYYQEAGRAGRDGVTAYCVLFYSEQDYRIQEYLIDMSFPPRETVEELYNDLFSQGKSRILQTYQEIGQRLGVNEMQVSAGLKLLERYGVLRRLNRSEQVFKALVKVPASQSKEKLSRAPLQSKVLQYLSNSTSEFFEWQRTLKDLNLSAEQLNRILRVLDERGLIQYDPPFRGRGIELLMPDQPLEKVKIDWEAYYTQKDIQLQHLKDMENYVLQRQCRRKYILNYFGEEYPADNCGACDVCLNWRSPQEEPLNDDLRVVVEAVAEFDTMVGSTRIAHMLKGIENEQNDYYGLNTSPFFGVLMEKSLEDIFHLIHRALRKKYIKKSKGNYPTLEVTEKGLRWLHKR